MAKNKNKYNNNKGEIMPKEEVKEQEQQVDIQIDENEAEVQGLEAVDKVESKDEQVITPEDIDTDSEILDAVKSEDDVNVDAAVDEVQEPQEPIVQEDVVEEELDEALDISYTPPAEPIDVVEEEVMEFTRTNIVDAIVYGEDELAIVKKLLLSAKAKYKESNIITRLLDAIESYLVAPASASKGGALVQTYAIEFNKAEKNDLTNLAIFMLTKLFGKESESRGLKSLSLISIVNTTRMVQDTAVKQEAIKLVDSFVELHTAEERKKKINVLISLDKAFVVNPRYLNANAVSILKEYFSKK